MKSKLFYDMNLLQRKPGVVAHNVDNDNIVAWAGKCWFVVGSLKKHSSNPFNLLQHLGDENAKWK